VAAAGPVLKGYTVLEERPNALGPGQPGLVEVPMLEVSSESLRSMSDEQLDQLLEQYLGITPRSFWSKAKRVSVILNAASQIVDAEEVGS
jgi:hypothetical protein